MENLFVVVYNVYYVCSCRCDRDVNEIQEYFVDQKSALSRAQELVGVYTVGSIKVCKVDVTNGRLVPGAVCQILAEG